MLALLRFGWGKSLKRDSLAVELHLVCHLFMATQALQIVLLTFTRAVRHRDLNNLRHSA